MDYPKGNQYLVPAATMEPIAAAFCKTVGLSQPDGMNAVDVIDCTVTQRDVNRPTLRHHRQIAASWRKICKSQGWL